MFLELFILALLVTIVVFSIRSGKRTVLDAPVIIHRPGQYHITIAPQLGCAQPFIEQIAARFASSHPPQGDLPSLYFEVRDPQVPGAACYLLAIAWRGGMLYCQAINPPPLRDTDSYLKALRAFSEAVLALHPLKPPVDISGVEQLRAIVDSVASQSNIAVSRLDQNG
ncbi:MAG: hypothetical protein HY938_10870 [Nitrosomonadales bacterium]|nr:hypothetical protein [Nitrosomonadales bacterium]